MEGIFRSRMIDISTNAIREFMRTDNLPQWPPEDYWWFGLMFAWGWPWASPGLPLSERKPFSVAELDKALLDLGEQGMEIRRPGAHTILELRHIAFVCREKRFKDGRTALSIAPHFKERKFGGGGHSFIEARGTAHEVARYLIGLDQIVPDLKTACLQAYYDGLQERREREDKLETARVFLLDFFGGTLPPGVVGIEIADSAPGAADLIRLLIHDADTPFWRTRLLDIPFDDRDQLPADGVQDFLDDSGLQFGAFGWFEDEDTGERIPAVRYRAYVSDTEREGLPDE